MILPIYVIGTNEIICSKDETSSEINIDDLKFSYEIMEEATYVVAKDTKIFCHWELNGKEKNIKIFMLYPNKILFEF
jgi:hypothetical protein